MFAVQYRSRMRGSPPAATLAARFDTMPELNVHFRPASVTAKELAGSVVVVIDLLRASSTICQALASGAECVMPFLEVDDARRAAKQYPRGSVVLGGERHGKIIEGFDLDNSPLEYTPATVAGKRVLFTTTNGTRALDHARLARRTLIGCALNRRAIAAAITEQPRVDILCAGTDGIVTAEDVLAAGAIVHALAEADRPLTMSTVIYYRFDAGAQTSIARWHDLLQDARTNGRTPAEQLASAMRDAPGGRNLLEIGHDADLPACAVLDALAVVPELNRATGEIRPA